HDGAVDDRAPAADLDQTFRIAVVMREDAFLVVTRSRASAVNGFTEQPRRTSELVERRQRTEPLQEQQDRKDGFGEVVALRRASGNIDDWQSECTSIILP